MHAIGARFKEYVYLTRLDRPIGIYLVLWPMLWALWIASKGEPDRLVFVVFVAGTVLMRSAGCAINDFADRKIDGHVRRTRQRPLARGAIHPGEAVAVFAVLSLIAFGLVLLLNRLTLLLSVVAVFLAASYPFMKRYTHLPQAYLGAAFGWAIPMAFAAQTGTVPAGAWILFAANIFWALAYDTMYAIADREDDLKIGVKSAAILMGRFDRLGIGLMQAMTLGLLAVAGLHFGLGPVFYAGLLAAGGFGLYEQYLIRDRDPQLGFQAFLNNHYFGMCIFAGIAVDYLIR
ncbi:4-hydroxybenzoate octaprenyltransferase [Thiohalomonas denitrificans]|uniref:4-hydroxybenzoate octaprenyltransferase n=1 Tax=Thiohalomonas denitrificans TaxID=415747 RepID=A0A1G5Q2U4_9GAMM|nr:4-hydroxybenzoate octaprenyltransferase [Thiohalomonas denitrificans]SCZ55711.1 4-hydroxybenzoate polyprenyltransferase [Thiohalomonas denitrificans]